MNFQYTTVDLHTMQETKQVIQWPDVDHAEHFLMEKFYADNDAFCIVTKQQANGIWVISIKSAIMQPPPPTPSTQYPTKIIRVSHCLTQLN